MEMTTDIEVYFAEGCGRCALGGTPQCKVHTWQEPLQHLRQLLQDTELTEEVKWGSPCYTYQGQNVILLSAFKEYCAINFLKGILLEDPENKLVLAGPNSHAARQFRFTETDAVEAEADYIAELLKAAVAVEKSGQKVPERTQEDPFPEELAEALEEDPLLKTAFENLTPGRQRSYLLHISGAKQPATRRSRIERCKGKIMEGKGFHDR